MASVIEEHFWVDQAVNVHAEVGAYVLWVVQSMRQACCIIQEELGVKDQVWKMLDVESFEQFWVNEPSVERTETNCVARLDTKLISDVLVGAVEADVVSLDALGFFFR